MSRRVNAIWVSAAILTVLFTLWFPATSMAASCGVEKGNTSTFRDNFSSGKAACWSPDEFGAWAVHNGSYVGQGTSLPPGVCTSPTSQTLITDFPAQDVDMHVDMTSILEVDKVFVLRSTGRGDQIELNFRARRPGAFPADLIVQEWSACTFNLLTPEFEVLTPPGVDELGQTIHVHVRLTGSRLHVWINAIDVLDRTFNFANGSTGAVGVGVLTGGTTAFDNVLLTTNAAPTPNCDGQVRAALNQLYGSLKAAAATLGFPSLMALQHAIRTECAG